MVIKEEWFVQFRTATDRNGAPYTLGTYPTPEEAKEAIHRIQKIDPDSIFYLSKITVNKTLVDTFFPLTDIKKYGIIIPESE